MIENMADKATTHHNNTNLPQNRIAHIIF